MCVYEGCTRCAADTFSRSSLSVEKRLTRGKKQVSKYDGKNADDLMEWSSKLRASLWLYSKLIFEIVQGSQRPSDLDDDQAAAREVWDDTNNNLYSILYFTTAQHSLSCGILKEKHKRTE